MKIQGVAMNIDNIQSQMRKGVLEFCILAIIKNNEVYPSEIIEQMKMSGLHVFEGTLYPLLTRLKNSGFLQYRWEESPSGPPRKYFQITESGLAFYQVLENSWEQMNLAVSNIIKTQMKKDNE
ncbi:MAG TPA: PadR family transcriptional regulator [Edaphocola sp.]|nr:PadR family transcriptional regulator [Edaphocola sp.]